MNISSPDQCHAGLTLLELIVVLAVLGGGAALAGLSWRGADVPEGIDQSDLALVRALQIDVWRSGTAAGVAITDNGGPGTVWVRPDGQVLGGDSLGLDPLNGARHD